MSRGRVRNARRVIDPASGLVFHSKRELRRWHQLLEEEQAGLITDLRRQVVFPLTAGGRPVLLVSRKGRRTQTRYVADFVYQRGADLVVEDAKGFDTELSRLKRAVLAAETGIVVILT